MRHQRLAAAAPVGAFMRVFLCLLVKRELLVPFEVRLANRKCMCQGCQPSARRRLALAANYDAADDDVGAPHGEAGARSSARRPSTRQGGSHAQSLQAHTLDASTQYAAIHQSRRLGASGARRTRQDAWRLCAGSHRPSWCLQRAREASVHWLASWLPLGRPARNRRCCWCRCDTQQWRCCCCYLSDCLSVRLSVCQSAVDVDVAVDVARPSAQIGLSSRRHQPTARSEQQGA